MTYRKDTFIRSGQKPVGMQQQQEPAVTGDAETHKLIGEVNNTMKAMKDANAQVNIELKASMEKTGKDATAALARADALSADITKFANQLLDVEQRISEKVVQNKTPTRTLGELVVKSEQFKAFATGAAGSFRIEANTITGQEGSPPENSDTIVAPYRQPGIVGGAFRNLVISDLLPSIQIASNAFEYTKELTYTNAAAETAEGAQKPQSTLTFELQTANIRTIATFLKASKQILDDSPALAQYINQRLTYAVNFRKEGQIVNGNGAGQNISGILQSGNHTVFTPVAGDTGLDSLNRAQALVSTSDYTATAYIMNPADWSALERIKGADGHYVIGNPLGLIGRVLWGLPVLVSNSCPAGTFIVANFDIAYTILERQGTIVEIFNQDDTNVQKNLLTIRGECRAALASQRPASCQAGLLLHVGT